MNFHQPTLSLNFWFRLHEFVVQLVAGRVNVGAGAPILIVRRLARALSRICSANESARRAMVVRTK